jgi:hypothetical protein
MLPMTATQSASISNLARTVGASAPTTFLLSADKAVAESIEELGGDAVSVHTSGRLTGVELLGGLITAEALGASADAGSESSGSNGRARPQVAHLRVGQFDARVDERGLLIDDDDLTPGAMDALNDALRDSLAAAGIVIEGATSVVTPLDSNGVRAEATGLVLRVVSDGSDGGALPSSVGFLLGHAVASTVSGSGLTFGVVRPGGMSFALGERDVETGPPAPNSAGNVTSTLASGGASESAPAATIEAPTPLPHHRVPHGVVIWAIFGAAAIAGALIGLEAWQVRIS